MKSMKDKTCSTKSFFDDDSMINLIFISTFDSLRSHSLQQRRTKHLRNVSNKRECHRIHNDIESVIVRADDTDCDVGNEHSTKELRARDNDSPVIGNFLLNQRQVPFVPISKHEQVLKISKITQVDLFCINCINLNQNTNKLINMRAH